MTLVVFIGDMSFGLHITFTMKHLEENIAPMEQVIGDVFKNLNSRLIRIDLKIIGFTMDEHRILKHQVLLKAFSCHCEYVDN